METIDWYTKECLRLYEKYNCGDETQKEAYYKELVQRKRIDIPFIEITMTTKCTLRCRYCSNLIPLHKSPEHFPKDEIIHDLDMLLNRVDWIYRLKLHGGEPLAYPWFAAVLEHALHYHQIKEVRASTNGTVAPTAKMLEVMQNERFILHISGYPDYRDSAFKLIDTLDKHNIRWYYMEGQQWQNLGNPTRKHNRTEEDQFLIAEECNMRKCTAYYHGKLFVCSFAANRNELFSTGESAYLNLRDDATVASMIRDFLIRRTYPECDWCNGILPDAEEIPAGEQI